MSNDPIAKRLLRDRATGGTVEIILHRPVQEPNDNQDWSCTIEIRGEGRSVAKQAFGVDALQALVSGLVALRHALRDEGARRLIWLGEPGDLGLPLIIEESDEDFLALIEGLITVEHSRQLVFRKKFSRCTSDKT